MSEKAPVYFRMIAFGLIALVLWSLAGVVFWAAIGNTYYGWVSQTWPKAEGVILRSEVEDVWVNEQRSDDSANSRPPRRYLRYRPVVEYEWRVRGITYQRSRRTFSAATADEESREDAEAILAPYSAGERIYIHYDPEKPSRGILEPGMHWDGFSVALIASLILAAFASVFSFLTWRSARA